MKSYFLMLSIAAVMMVACGQKKNVDSVETAPVVQQKASVQKELVYEGILPCADCSGIKTTVKIMPGDGTGDGHRFELTSVYLGKEKDNTFITNGSFNYERGLDDDQDATVYVLNWDKSDGEKQYFVVYSNDSTTMYSLDRQGKRIKSDMNYSLKLKN